MAEIAFEYLLAGIETARGTAQTTPTRMLNLVGTVTPKKARYRPRYGGANLAEYNQSADVRKWSEFEGEGPCDIYTLPLLLNTLVAGGIDGSGETEAAVTIDPDGDNNALVFTAVTAGVAGNRINIEYVDPGADNSPLDVDVHEDGRSIKVYLATDGDGRVTSTADLVKAAIAAHPIASGLVTVADAAANDGSGVVTAMDTTYLAGGVGAAIATPSNGVLTRLWTFAPTMTEDDLDSMTLFWGDPNVQAFRSTFCMLDELKVIADTAGTDGVVMSISGMGQFPSKNAPAVVPAMLKAPLLLPGAMQLWVDTSSAIGSTEVTGRVVKAEVTIPLGGSRKWVAAGPTSTLGFNSVGRNKRHIQIALTLELPDTTQYDLWVAQTSLKLRLRFNGPLIESVTPDYYYYFEVDAYGPLEELGWGEHEGTNRTAELTLISEYDAVAGYDWAVKVQTTREAL